MYACMYVCIGKGTTYRNESLLLRREGRDPALRVEVEDGRAGATGRPEQGICLGGEREGPFPAGQGEPRGRVAFLAGEVDCVLTFPLDARGNDGVTPHF